MTDATCSGTVTTGHSRFGGQFVATCDSCHYVCTYWDDDDIDPDTGEVDFSHNYYDKYEGLR